MPGNSLQLRHGRQYCRLATDDAAKSSVRVLGTDCCVGASVESSNGLLQQQFKCLNQKNEKFSRSLYPYTAEPGNLSESEKHEVFLKSI